QEITQARLDQFFAPFDELEEVRRMRDLDALFPLGRTWQERELAPRPELRPRDAVNYGRDGWRLEQEELSRLGPEDWLRTGPERQGIHKPAPTAPTADEVQTAIDRATDEWMSKHGERRRKEPGSLPPDADQLAGLLCALLRQCEEDRDAGLIGVLP